MHLKDLLNYFYQTLKSNFPASQIFSILNQICIAQRKRMESDKNRQNMTKKDLNKYHKKNSLYIIFF